MISACIAHVITFNLCSPMRLVGATLFNTDCLLFFKQKTAYERRMRDWSSDVCSSDLGKQFNDPSGEAVRGRAVDNPVPIKAGRTDRKSVASGKRVSVRVERGGRRIITKKKLTTANGSVAK